MYHTDAPRQAQQQQPYVERQTRRFDGICFFWDKTGHREAECQQKARDIPHTDCGVLITTQMKLVHQIVKPRLQVYTN